MDSAYKGKVVRKWVSSTLALALTASGLFLGPAPSSAAAVTMVSDNFNAQFAGTTPDTTKWKYTSTVSSAGVGTTSATVAEESSGGNKVLEFNSTLTAGSSRSVNSTIAFPLTGSRNDALIDLRVRYNFKDWAKVTGTPVFQAYSGSKRLDSTNVAWQDLLKFYTDSAGKGFLKFEFDKTNPVTVITDVVKGQWYDIRILARAADNNGSKMTTADLYINGNHLATSTIPSSSVYGFTAYQITDTINQSQTNFSAGSLKFWVDDVSFVQNPDVVNPDNGIDLAAAVSGDVDLTQPMAIKFTRAMDAKTLTTAGNVKVNDQAVLVKSVALDANDSSKVLVTFNITPGLPADYTLSFTGIKDFYGNTMPTRTLPFHSKKQQGFFTGDFYFYKNDRTLYELETGSLLARTNVQNFTDESRPVKLVVSKYNGTTLEGTEQQIVTLAPQTVQNVELPFTISDISGDRYIEVALLDARDGVTNFRSKVKLDRYSAYWHSEDYDYYLLSTIDRSQLKTPTGKFEVTPTGDLGIYERPNSFQIVNAVRSHSNGAHPRILATADTFATIKANLATDKYVKTGHLGAIQAADGLLNTPVIPFAMSNNVVVSQRNLVDDYKIPDYIMKLGYAYQMTGDVKYAERAWKEMENVINFPHWGNKEQGQFLGTGQVLFGMAIGYDWFFDYLTADQKKRVRNAIIEKGIKPGMLLFSLNNPGGYTPGTASMWMSMESNWNQVGNGGLVTASLAILDEEPDLAGRMLENTIRSLEWGTAIYKPDGAYEEGVGYWAYGTGFMINAFSSLENAAGTIFGLDKAQGLQETPLFLVYLRGPGGSFNYHDAGEDPKSSPVDAEMHWFATHYNSQTIYSARMYTAQQQATATIKDILYYRPGKFQVDFNFPLDAYYEGHDNVVGTSTFRSSWVDADATFFGMHAGTNNMSGHQQYDTGHFILDSLGQRWAIDVGDGRNDGPNYFAPGGNYFYRKRTEGHNTILMNPDSSVGQDMYDTAKLVKYESKPKGGMMITDMTTLYDSTISSTGSGNLPNVGTSVVRGIMYDRVNNLSTVQDEIKTSAPSTLYWFMHTRASIQIAQDGRSAILTQGGRQLQAIISGGNGATFSIMDPVMFPITNPQYPLVNMPTDPNLKKLTIKFTNSTEVNVAVTFKPLPAGEQPLAQAPALKKLSEWSISDGQINKLTLDSLTLDGQLIKNFTNEGKYYDIILNPNADTAPVVAATSQFRMTISQSTGVPGQATVTLTDPETPGRTATVTINFRKFKKFEGFLDFYGVEASLIQEAANTPEKSIDGDLSTPWTAEGDQWIKYDLGSVKRVAGIAVAWGSGNVRSAKFDLETSEDGVTWKNVYSGYSSGTTLDLEMYSFPTVSAQFVRIYGHGNTLSAWNNVREVRVLEGDVQPPVTVATINPAQPDGQNGWYRTPVSIDLSAVDSVSGVAGTEYTLNGGATWTPYAGTIVIGQEGQTTVGYRSTDIAGNQEATRSVNVSVDSTAPSTTAAVTSTQGGGNGWYSHPVTVMLNAVDSGSSVAQTVYSLDGGTHWNVYTGTFQVSQDGSYTIQYRSKDKAGNEESVKTILFDLDATAPVIAVGIPTEGGRYRDSETLTLQFSVTESGGSGLATGTTTATLDGRSVQNGQSIDLTGLSLGNHTLIVSSSDEAGNVNTVTITFMVYADRNSLIELINRLSNSGAIDSKGIANSLLAKIKAGSYNDLIAELQSQSGKHINANAVALLIRGAQYVLSQ
ncbi:OmpL47-type beta-barrel domain-containing protein [Paenibacillus roseipurpureus]|uniref:Discoidin domain-containing protein n=1 Tax=Paenibacillus roseopurpureus TaxID=2918901 RepID=A0AA96LN76_9BACL|nr:discoidin domain-containing protein [Paenibacillus sp. MBLB1832]WNR42939.1 discoidin domain-containing protein [Paenibacillus sp. MBLB1832]